MPVRSSLLGIVLLAAPLAAQHEIRFNRDVRPILSDKCFRCHGPDRAARKAELRLDVGTEAVRAGVITPGRPGESELIARIEHADPGERMPPAASGKSLDHREISLLRRWIADGAEWEEHWSFAPLVRPGVPAASSWARNPVDALLEQRLRAIGLRPSPPADPRTAFRRLHLDLTGLPPAPEDVAAFVADPTGAAWERVVDRLLASPHHAERLTMYWLDLVRYGDSCGIHGDQPISMWPYRDWVIRTFHANKPFDEFTREQIAGDLLPEATLQQQVASGYNRLNPKTAEGGAQDKEYLAKYAADRVRTTGSVWLGVTIGCAECHDHKFDPITTRDFYRFAAFFADLEGRGFYGNAHVSGDWGPKVSVPGPYERRILAGIEQEMRELEARIADADVANEQDAWEQRVRPALAANATPQPGPWELAGPFTAASLRAAHDTAFAPERDQSAASWKARPKWTDGKVHRLRGASAATYLRRAIESPVEQTVRLSLGSDDSLKLWVNGDLVLDRFVTRGAAPGQEKPRITLRAGRNEILIKVCNGGGAYGFYFAIAASGPPAEIAATLQRPKPERTAGENARLAAYFRSIAPSLAGPREKLAAKRDLLAAARKAVPTSLVSRARKTPRVTRVLPRGNWMDDSGEVVHPGVPEFLRQPAGERLGRLDLAEWLTSRDNPLTARAFVNRLWKLCFGRGLTRTLDDLGSQGDWPRHLALLDWLAAEFADSGWDVRHVVRLLVTSSAYRQSSALTPQLQRMDPENREFARQERFRHDAEVVRDIALSVSGLLDPTLGGPSVKPYQPKGYWGQLNFPKREWKRDSGSALYRRGLYTHWQRTFLHPSLRAFDAPAREECTAERVRSNTPLQALALLNDPTFVEAARVLAERVLRENSDFDARLRFAFGRVLQRRPSLRETETLRRLFERERERFAREPTAARALTTAGDYRPAEDLDVTLHAAWTTVARALLNLHETITRY